MTETKYIKEPCDICGAKIIKGAREKDWPSGCIIQMFHIDENKEYMDRMAEVRRLICDDCWNVFIDLLKPDKEADND